MIEAGIQAVQDLRELDWDEIEEDDEELEEMLEQELEQLANSKPVRKSVLH